MIINVATEATHSDSIVSSVIIRYRGCLQTATTMKPSSLTYSLDFFLVISGKRTPIVKLIYLLPLGVGALQFFRKQARSIDIVKDIHSSCFPVQTIYGHGEGSESQTSVMESSGSFCDERVRLERKKNHWPSREAGTRKSKTRFRCFRKWLFCFYPQLIHSPPLVFFPSAKRHG